MVVGIRVSKDWGLIWDRIWHFGSWIGFGSAGGFWCGIEDLGFGKLWEFDFGNVTRKWLQSRDLLGQGSAIWIFFFLAPMG